MRKLLTQMQMKTEKKRKGKKNEQTNNVSNLPKKELISVVKTWEEQQRMCGFFLNFKVTLISSQKSFVFLGKSNIMYLN